MKKKIEKLFFLIFLLFLFLFSRSIFFAFLGPGPERDFKSLSAAELGNVGVWINLSFHTTLFSLSI